MIVPERLDTPTTKELKGLADEFDRLRGQVQMASKGDDAAAKAASRMGLGAFLEGLEYRGLVPKGIADKARKWERPSGEVGTHLRKKARFAAADITLPQEVTAKLQELGYKPVVTSGDVLMTSDVEKLGEVMGAGDYTRRAAFFETIGLSPRVQSDESLFQLREA